MIGEGGFRGDDASLDLLGRLDEGLTNRMPEREESNNSLGCELNSY